MSDGTFRIEAPSVDVINTIATTSSKDEAHRIYFRDGGEVVSWTLAELDRRARNVARGLQRLGVRPGDRVGIQSLNRIEWVLADLAVLKIGGVTAAVEPGRFEPDHIIEKYGLRAFFCEGAVTRGPVYAVDAISESSEDPGAGAAPFVPFGGYDPADICQIKQTSGSTGVPKGIETTVVSVNSSITEVQKLFRHGDGDNILVMLPLWFLQQRWWIYSALVFGHDVSVTAFEDTFAMAQSTSPTVVMGVPRFYDDLRARIARSHGEPATAEARREVIQAELGGRIRYLWTGSAPAARATLEYFNESGVPLYEGYGLNETCIVAKNHPGAFRLGSVGRILPNKSVRLDANGILVVASHHPVNTRYTWCSPGDNEKIWLPTGEVRTYDLAHIDEDGFLYMHGRVDDVISTSAGPNILLPPIEAAVRELPGVHECVLFGQAKPFLSALVSPRVPGPELEELGARVATLNETLRPEQRVLALIVAPVPFTVAGGLLNTQFKPRRAEIHRRYAAELDLIYQKFVDDLPAMPVIVAAQPLQSSDREQGYR